MITPEKFYKALNENSVTFFAGVPDSLLKSFCAYLSDHTSLEKNIITANEGGAVALAAGHYLATGQPGLVYMQNSGLGNAVNPLTSLADEKVYSIPLLLLIGWRAEPGVKDEPQHAKMGEITLKMLETLKIPYRVLGDNFEKTIREAKDYMIKNSAPFAIVVKKDTFESYPPARLSLAVDNSGLLSREEAIKTIVPLLEDDNVIVSTTGMASRELFELRERNKQGHERDFLTVGSMGHASQIALGIALEKPSQPVYCFDGDGAVIMHMGHLAIIGQVKPENFRHIVFNNLVHDSVGGQPTAASSISLAKIAEANGYKKAFSVKTKKELGKAVNRLKNIKGPVLVEVKIKSGARADLGRPTSTPIENKKTFMDFLLDDSAEKLAKILTANKVKNIFLVTGKSSYVLSGAEKKFKKILSSCKVTQFSDFDANPNLKDLKNGIQVFKKEKYDLVLAVGGGSALDMAKLINILAVQKKEPVNYIRGENKITQKGKPLIAVPTTSGTGSETTHFAVVYIDKVKYSIAHQYILPDYFILDSGFTLNLSPSITASTGMDALCQAIEAYWSVNSTEISKAYSREAIKLAINNLEEAVKVSTLKSRKAMLKAAHLAGQAINIAKTTAPHAISYILTSHFGIPHGQAVGLTMGKVFEYNCRPKSVKFNKAELCSLLGVASASVGGKRLKKLMQSIGLETRLSRLGVKEGDLEMIASSVNLERLKNNPVVIKKDQLKKILKSIL